jgi:hypothetical protein
LTDTSTSAKLDARGERILAMSEDEQPPKREILFCPYCFQQQFDRREIPGSRVHCAVCGVDVEVKELVKP